MVDSSISEQSALIDAISSAAEEWNSALRGLGVWFSIASAAERKPVIKIELDGSIEVYGSDSVFSRAVSFSTDTDPVTMDCPFFLAKGTIRLNTKILADPEYMRELVLYQLGSAVGINNPDFTGKRIRSLRSTDQSLHAKHLTDYDVQLCKELYRNHSRISMLFADTEIADRIPNLSDRRIRKETLKDEMSILMRQVYDGASR